MASRAADPARRSHQPHRCRRGAARRPPGNPGEGAGLGGRRSLGRGDRRAAAALRRPGAGAAALRLLLRRGRGRQRRSPRPGTSLRRQRRAAQRPPRHAVGACQARHARPGWPGGRCGADARDRRRRLRQPARRDPRSPGDDAAASRRPVRPVRGARPRRLALDCGKRHGQGLLAGFAAPRDGPILDGHDCGQRLPQRQLRAGADRRPPRLRTGRRAFRHRPGAPRLHHPGSGPEGSAVTLGRATRLRFFSCP